MFNPEYYVGTIGYLMSELEKIPEYRMGVHRGQAVIREYQCGIDRSQRVRQVKADSPKGRKLLSSVQKRNELKYRINSLISEFENTYNMNYKKAQDSYSFSDQYKHPLDNAFWSRLQSSCNTYPKNNNYCYKGTHFRSRAEVRFAETLDKLGLQYRYEVRIWVGKKEYDVDFVIWLPQFNCCILIEYFGSMTDPHRIQESGSKFMTYSRAGIMSGEDIIYFCGTENKMPATSTIEETVTGVINGISRQHVILMH